MNKLTRRVFWLSILLLVVAALTAVTALHGTTPTTTFAHDSRHRTPTPTPTTPTTPTPTPPTTPLMITTTSLPNGNVCASYTAYITANKGGGSSLDTWTIVSGKLPVGLTMATSYGIESTVVYGTPTTVQTTMFTVKVQDSAGETATQPLSITIDKPLPLVNTSPTPPPATVGSSYFTNLFANGGCQPYTWSITAGQLPPGLALTTGSNGGTTISGTPTAKGTFTFTETVTDSTGVHTSQQFSITVN
jgi:Putative Ig domain